MTHNSKKAWKNIKKLNSEKSTQDRVAAVTPNQVANHLLQNGIPTNKEKGHQMRLKTKLDQAIAECDDQLEESSLSELRNTLTFMKTRKACSLDGIKTEMIQHFGLTSMSWILNLSNKYANTNKIPKGWRKARVVALLTIRQRPSNK